MARAAPRKNATGTRGRPFTAGNSGRPLGARNKATLAVEAMLEGEAEALTRRAIQSALGGDTAALKLCLDRIAPARKERTIQIAMPPVGSAAEVPKAMMAVFEAVTIGQISPGEGFALAVLLEKTRAAHEAANTDCVTQAVDDLLGHAGGF